jgi:hypothetical protein
MDEKKADERDQKQRGKRTNAAEAIAGRAVMRA